MTASAREDEIRQDIERTREQLGATVEALTRKVDVPARLKGKVHETTQILQVKAERVTEHILEGAAALQGQAGERARQVERLIHQALDKLPPPVTARIEPLVALVRRRPLPAAVVAMSLTLRCLLRKSR